LERNSVAIRPAMSARTRRAGCERANPQERSWSGKDRSRLRQGEGEANRRGGENPRGRKVPMTREQVIGKTGRLRRQTLQGKELQERCIGSARAGAVSSREASRRQATGVRSPSASKTEGDIGWKQTRRAPPETAKVERGGCGSRRHPIHRVRRLRERAQVSRKLTCAPRRHDPDPTLIL